MSKEARNLPGDASSQQAPTAGGPGESLPRNRPTEPTRPDAIPGDYSDIESIDSQSPSSSRRRHQRGGRRKRPSESERSAPVPAPQSPMTTQSQDQGTQTDSDSRLEPYSADYDEEALEKARSSRVPEAKGPRSPKKSKTKRTGVKGFNIKRAESSGGRPMGISIERPKDPSKAKGKRKEKARKTKEQQPETKAEEGNLNEDQEDEYETDEDEETETETETRKPVSIRLDLNLEVEIFLRAKIKGDVTITFL